MSRYVLITPNSDFERLVRLAMAGMHGSLQVFQSGHLPDGPGTSSAKWWESLPRS